MIQSIKKAILLVSCSLMIITINAQISIRANVDSTAMLIGDQQALTLTIQHPTGASIKSFYRSALDTVTNFEIIRESDWDTTSTSPITIQKDITFSIFDSGYYFIPRIPHSFIINGDTTIKYSNNIPIIVNTVTAQDSTMIAPIRPIREEPVTLEDFLPYIYVLLGLLGLGFLIYYLSKRKKVEVQEIIKPEVIIPAHDKALEKLRVLKEKELWQNDQQKEYHSELTYIVREYLENRYGVAALESSTHEILQDLKKVEFDDRFKDNLTEMLNIADLVKFAKAESTADINTRIIQQAEEFVNATKEDVTEE